jgi:hypothetical protein
VNNIFRRKNLAVAAKNKSRHFGGAKFLRNGIRLAKSFRHKVLPTCLHAWLEPDYNNHYITHSNGKI